MVAAVNMPVGTVVTAEMVMVERVPVLSLVAGGLASDVELIVGKTVIVERAVGDVIPLAVLGAERLRPQDGNGFITVSLPIGGAAGAVVGDTVDIIVFGNFSVPQLLEGFTVVGRVVREREMNLVLEADVNSLLLVVPHIASRAFEIIRR